MNRAHLIRLNPTQEQEMYFRKACGVARHAYNWALARWKAYRKQGKWAKMKDLKAEYNQIKKEQFPWCFEVTKCAPEQEFSNLGQAFENYWRMKEEGTLPKLKHPRKDGEEGGFPRFKSKKRNRLSFYLSNDKFSISGSSIRIPKLGTVNMTEPLRFQGKILSAVISYRAGWWFVSISVEVEHEVPTHRGGAVGIDLGLKTLAILSDGMVFENQKHYRRNLGRIKGLSKGLSRKVEGSRNWWKNSKRLAKAHYRVACQRQDMLHKMTTHVARTYALIGLEDLNVKGMLANHCLAQATSDASFFEVKRQLLYKSEQHGGSVQLVDRWYASSKTCHACGWVKDDLTLADRTFMCEQCGGVLDRDFNASLNIRDEAIRLIREVPVVASSGQEFACGVGSSGSFCAMGETFCGEASTKMSFQTFEYIVGSRKEHMRMKGRAPEVVVVTGASAGVGRAVARAFARRGAQIGLVARGQAGLEGARRDVEALGGKGLVLPIDVADADQVEAAAARVEETFGPIAIWVNDAMTTVFSPAREMTPEEYRRVTEVSYLGTVYGTLAALRRMLPRDQGRIIQIGSALAYRGIPLQSAYCGAKHAIQGFTESVRSELIHDKSNVKITMVQLPAVNTPQFGWVKSRLPHKAQPVPPIYQPEVIADAVIWIADHYRRQLFIGGSTVMVIQGDKLAPWFGDWYLGETSYTSQQIDEPEDPKRPNNLWEPVDEDHDYGAHGSFDNQAHGRSWQLWADTHRGWLALAGAGVVSLIGAAVFRRKR